jgi:hypothetical protein
MADLSLFAFTPRSDNAFSSSGWDLDRGGAVNALSGNDEITCFYGLNNLGLIETGAGLDVIQGSGHGGWEYTGLGNYGVINTGADSDSLIGIAGYEATGLINDGIVNTGAGDDFFGGFGNYRYDGIISGGTIFLGPGNDVIHGQTELGTGISNSRRILTGSGDDIIKGCSEEYIDISNHESGEIKTGDGNDLIEGFYIDNDGLIDMGSGGDVITGDLDNAGTVNLGDGNDRIIELEGRYLGLGSISNSGLISAGAGSDVLGNFNIIFGDGVIDMGAGNDTLRAFGTGLFIGGVGIDTLSFAPGVYAVAALESGEFQRFGRGAGFLSLHDAAELGTVVFV